jgi:hypothetical protein
MRENGHRIQEYIQLIQLCFPLRDVAVNFSLVDYVFILDE